MATPRCKRESYQYYRMLIVRTLFRIWPLLLTLILKAPADMQPNEKIASLGIGALAVAIALMFFLMTEEGRKKPRSGFGFQQRKTSFS